MVGVDQCGVSDTIEFILQYYPPDVQQRLVEVRIATTTVTGVIKLSSHCQFSVVNESLCCMVKVYRVYTKPLNVAPFLK